VKRLSVFLSILTIVSISVFAQTKIQKPATGSLSASIAHGKKVYVQYCLSCHQADGEGVQNMNPPLAGSPYVLGDKSRIIKLVLNGFNEGVEIKGQSYTNPMPSFNYLKDKDIADVLTYIRNNFTNKADAVTPAEVTPARAVKK
jgi:mono/diheme cytochrome c family protein